MKSNRRLALLHAVLWSLLAAGGAGWAQTSDWTITQASQVGGWRDDLVVTGNVAVLVEGYGVSLYDISGSTPAKLSTLGLPVEPVVLAAAGTNLYTLSGWWENPPLFSVVDISDPAAPVLRGSCETFYSRQSMAVFGSHVYAITDNTSNLVQVLNVSDPTNPVVAATLDIPALALAIADGKLYVQGADSYTNKFWVYDLASPTAPSKVGELSGGIYSSYALCVSGSNVYSAGSSSGVQIFDVSNPSVPSLVNSFQVQDDGSSMWVEDVYVHETTLWAMGKDNGWPPYGVAAVDVANAYAPTNLGVIAIDGMARIDGAGSKAVAMSMGDMAVSVMSLVGGVPTLLGQAGTPYISDRILATDQGVYMGSSEHLWLFGMTNPASPVPIHHDTRWGGFMPGAVVAGHLAAFSNDTLELVDCTVPTNWVLSGAYVAPTAIRSIACSGSNVFLLSWVTNAAVEIVDVSNPASPSQLGTLPVDGTGLTVSATADLACLGGANGTGDWINIFTVTNPASPVLESSPGCAGVKPKAWLEGTNLFVASITNFDGTGGGIEVYDMTTPSAPVLATNLTGQGRPLDLLVLPRAGQDSILLTANPGGSVHTYGYTSEGTLYEGPICHSPYSLQVTATPTANGYLVGTTDSSFGTYYQIIEQGGSCRLITGVSPQAAADEGCKAEPASWGPGPCGSEVEVSATAVSPWNFKEWTGAASGSSPTATATVNANPSEAVAHFVTPVLTLGAGLQNPAADTEVYGIEGPYDYANGKQNVPIIHIALSANDVDDWTVTSVGFNTSGSGNESNDVSQARLYLGSIGGTLLGTRTFSADNGTLTFSMNVPISKGSSVSMILVYDMVPDKAYPCNGYAALTHMGMIAATPDTYANFVKLPVPPTGVNGGPTRIKRGELDLNDGNEQYGQAGDPATNAPLAKALKVRLRYGHPAGVDHVTYTITAPPGTPTGAGAFLGSTLGTLTTQKTLDGNGYAEETCTLGTRKGKKNPYYIEMGMTTKGEACGGSWAAPSFTEWGQGVEFTTTAQYDNPANGDQFGTFLGTIEAVNRFTVDIDMAPEDFATVEDVVFDVNGTLHSGEAVTPNEVYRKDLDAQTFESVGLLKVTVKMDQSGVKLEEKVEYPLKCLSLPGWVAVVNAICHPESFSKQFEGESSSYKFAFNYPTDFAWNSLVPGDVGLLGGLDNDLGIAFNATCDYKVDESSAFGATVSGEPKILGKELALEGNLTGEFDPNFAFERGSGTLRASVSFDLPEKSMSKTFIIYGVPITAAVDLGGNVEIFVSGTAVLNRKLELEQVSVKPGTTVTGEITISLSAVFGLAKIAAQGSPSATVEIELTYKTAGGTSVTWSGEVVVPLKIYGSLFWGLASAELYSTQFGPWTFGSGGGGGAPAIPIVPLDEAGSPPRLLSSSSLAVDAGGHRMLVYIGDTDPGGAAPNPDVFFRYYDGTTWSNAQPIIGGSSPNAEWETDPCVIALPPSAALAVWTANKGATNLTLLSEILAKQDIAWSLWDGAAWTAPARIIDDEQADGSAALSYDAAHDRVMTAWVHNSDPATNPVTRTAWELRYALFDVTQEVYSAGSAVPGTDGGQADFMPALASDATGDTLLVWIRDDDGVFYQELGAVTGGSNVDPTNSDCNVCWSLWDGTNFTAVASITSSNTATELSPAVSFAPTNQAIAVWVEHSNTVKRLLYSLFDVPGKTWSAPAPVTESDQFIEDPNVLVKTSGEAAVVWRGAALGANGSGNLLVSYGQLPTPTWSAPEPLTDDDAVQWQACVALDGEGDLLASWDSYNPATGATGGVVVADSGDAALATLTGDYSVQVPDADTNGLYDALIYSLTGTVTQTGDFEVRGALYAGSNRIAHASTTTAIGSTGEQALPLSFLGGMLSSVGLDGPYDLRDVRVVASSQPYIPADSHAGPLATPTNYLAAEFEPGLVSLDKDSYVNVTNVMLVTVTDANANTNAAGADSLVVRVTSAEDMAGIDLTLNETGDNTGIFQATLGFDPVASSQPQAKIRVADHTLVSVSYDDAVRDFLWMAQAPWYHETTTNGVPIVWMDLYNLTNTPYEAEMDQDRDDDGLAAWQEYVANTDPTNPNSVLWVGDFVTRVPPTNLVFSSSTGRLYTLEFTTNLAGGSWSAVPGASGLGDGGDVTLSDTNPPPDVLYYRIRVELP